jgi:hypothetical protein
VEGERSDLEGGNPLAQIRHSLLKGFTINILPRDPPSQYKGRQKVGFLVNEIHAKIQA